MIKGGKALLPLLTDVEQPIPGLEVIHWDGEDDYIGWILWGKAEQDLVDIRGWDNTQPHSAI